MNRILISGLLLIAVTGCTTKVYNTPPAAQGPTVIEHDRPVVHDRVIERPVVTDRDTAPKVENNIRVDR